MITSLILFSVVESVGFCWENAAEEISVRIGMINFFIYDLKCKISYLSLKIKGFEIEKIIKIALFTLLQMFFVGKKN